MKILETIKAIKQDARQVVLGFGAIQQQSFYLNRNTIVGLIKKTIFAAILFRLQDVN
jgi:hypothetical protein